MALIGTPSGFSISGLIDGHCFAGEVKRVFADKDFVEKYVISRGQVPAINTPEEFAAEIKADRAAAQQVVKAAGMQPQ